MDDERLNNPDGRPDHFDEMLARIRDILASEKRFYQKVRDLFALSTDYDKTERAAQQFFATVQGRNTCRVHKRSVMQLSFEASDTCDASWRMTPSAYVPYDHLTSIKSFITGAPHDDRSSCG